MLGLFLRFWAFFFFSPKMQKLGGGSETATHHRAVFMEYWVTVLQTQVHEGRPRPCWGPASLYFSYVCFSWPSLTLPWHSEALVHFPDHGQSPLADLHRGPDGSGCSQV